MMRTTRTRHLSTSSDYTHAVIGAGAVGLAIARRLAQYPGTSTVLLEQHAATGTETSSRNSEVVHAGLYYGPDSFKTRLCLRGKELLYDLCTRHRIPFRRCGKWNVAQDETERKALDEMHAFAATHEIPTRFLSRDRARAAEPRVRALAGVLESPKTGILDSHAYMQYLETSLTETGGDVALRAKVTAIEPGPPRWTIHTDTGDKVSADVIVNSAGLYACEISNMILGPDRHRTPFYAKGTYYTCTQKLTSRLIYPAPKPGSAGLGTHLTLDLAGQTRFGPDVEWVTDPTDLAPNTDQDRLGAATAEIRRYLPDIKKEALGVGYAGIRPKLGRLGAAVVAGSGIQDFYIQREDGFDGFVNLLAIESPGLTSSLAIADYVHSLLYAS